MDNYDLYKLHYSFPILYGIEKNGKVKSWKASIHKHINNDTAISIIEFGQLDGKKQTATREYTEGKNIGKKNETTPLQQCMNETKKKWTDKRDKESYKEDNKEDNKENDIKEDIKEEKYFPMLAHTYDPNTSKNKKNDIVFPCYVQPKLDGLRCIMYKDNNGSVKCQSRTGTYFDSMDHISEEIKNSLKSGIILDGELYTNDIPFEELAGLIKKKKITEEDKERLKKVKYHIYDVINSDIYEKRLSYINNSINEFSYIVRVQTYLVKDKTEFKNYFSKFIEDGYEGIMLRNINGLYRCNYRSHDLQKYKEFLESEYTISGFKEGDGRDKGTVIWICKTENKEFSVRPRGSMEMRKEWFSNGDKYVGKKLTVIYQELSELGIPRFPVGKAVRDCY